MNVDLPGPDDLKTMPPLFVSIFAYVLGKETDDAAGEVKQEIARGEQASWPGFRTLARVREQVGPLQLLVNHSSLIAKARSMALGAFLDSGADRWLSIDDDIDACYADLCTMLLAPTSEYDVLIAPCALRGGEAPSLNFVLHHDGEPPGGRVRVLSSGARVFPIVYGGMAISMVTRKAAEEIHKRYPDLTFYDHLTGHRGVAAFLETVESTRWYGEDFAFCRRARECGLRIDALAETTITHAGVTATVDPRYLDHVH